MNFDNYMCDEQMSIFDFTHQTFKIDKPIRLIETFAGVGSQAMSLETLGADFEHYRVVEFDKYAIESYNAIHGTDFPTMDITKVNGEDLGIVDADEYCYIMTYSFPCQDLSVAGKGKGMAKGSGTRSGLLWEVERLLNEVDNLPQVLVMENVPMVHGEGNKKDFQKWIEFLESKGYSCWYEDLNAKWYGVAQSRDRCFMVSVLGDYQYKFPKPIPLTRKMKDYLEEEVDEKYYINSEKAQELISQLITSGELDGRTEYVDRDVLQIGNIMPTGNRDNPNQGRVYDEKGLCPTLTDMQGGNRQPMVVEPICLNPKGGRGGVEGLQPSVQDRVYSIDALSTAITTGFMPSILEEQNSNVLRIREATKKGYAECKIGGMADLLYPTSTTRRGWVQDMGDTCPTILSGENGLHRIESMYRIRKLSPKECWRLMDFSDEDFHKAEKVCSNTQLYKQAGNSIVKNCLVAIFGQMIPGKENVYKERFNEG